MSLLDELRNEAAARKTDEARAKAYGSAEVARARAELEPCMHALHGYFKEFIEHLQVLNPDLTRRCEVEGFGVIGKLRQHDYRFWTAEPDDVTHFSFGFTLSSNERPQSRMPAALADKTQSQLKSIGIPCAMGPVSSEHATLTLQPKIPVTFEFDMDIERARVRLHMRNHESVGTVVYRYAPESITEALMENLAALVLAKDNQFEHMSRSELEAHSREELRRSLAREERRRQAELGGAVAKASWALGEGVRRLFGKR